MKESEERDKRIAEHKAFGDKIAKIAVDNLNRNVLQEQEDIQQPEVIKRASTRLCPFCDGAGREDSVTVNEITLERQYFVRCISCGAESGWAKTLFGAWMNWNMRTQRYVRLELRITALEAQIRQLEKEKSDLGWQLNSDRQGGA